MRLLNYPKWMELLNNVFQNLLVVLRRAKVCIIVLCFLGFFCLLGLSYIAFNAWCHIVLVLAFSSGTLITNNAAILKCHVADIEQDTPPPHSLQTQDMTHPSQLTETGHDTHPLTAYRHRTWHPTPQLTDPGHDTPPSHSLQTQDMTTHPLTAYRHRTWHTTPSQLTDTRHDTPPPHSLQTQGMTPPSQLTDTGHDTPPPQLTDTGCDTPPPHSLQTQDMTPHPLTAYRRRTWHPTPS